MWNAPSISLRNDRFKNLTDPTRAGPHLVYVGFGCAHTRMLQAKGSTYSRADGLSS